MEYYYFGEQHYLEPMFQSRWRLSTKQIIQIMAESFLSSNQTQGINRFQDYLFGGIFRHYLGAIVLHSYPYLLRVRSVQAMDHLHNQ